MMERVFIGFGSNIGESEKICRDAVRSLGRLSGVAVLEVSSLYSTEPVGKTDQGWFVNGVALCETVLGPRDMLYALQGVELQFGRVRAERWGPRTLDLDILLFGERRIDEPDLVVPHPRLHERRFVLAPMVEIEPELVHPVLGVTMKELLDRLDGAAGQEVRKCSSV